MCWRDPLRLNRISLTTRAALVLRLWIAVVRATNLPPLLVDKNAARLAQRVQPARLRLKDERKERHTTALLVSTSRRAHR